jgi:UDP-2,4-diacetamido-2,4,6-trideoxy-beta-L-altropyranose hydrolase
MSMHRVVIRCDGGRNIGLGHIMRCLALADMLRNQFQILFVLQETSEDVYALIQREGWSYEVLPESKDVDKDLPLLIALLSQGDIVVLDGYEFKTEYQYAIRQRDYRVVAIDDLHAWHHYADVILNHAGGVSESSYSCETYTHLMLGPSHTLLRKEFFEQQTIYQDSGEWSRFFISMGAADTGGNTLKIAQALLSWPTTKKIVLMVSTLNPHLEALKKLEVEQDRVTIAYNLNASQLIDNLQNTDVVICPASTISLETCAVGRYLLTGYTAANQMNILQGLLSAELAFSLGDINMISPGDFLEKLKFFYTLPQRKRMLLNQKAVINVKTKELIQKTFHSLSSSLEEMICRPARRADLMLYYAWVNDTEVRKNSFQTSQVNLKDHTNWFEKQIQSGNALMLLFFQNDEPIGQVRFTIEEDKATINFSIAKDHRGRGLASELISRASKELTERRPEIRQILAEVKPSNMASSRAFEKCGFSEISKNLEKIIYCKVTFGPITIQ